jgi:hypothetical protein
MNPVAPSTIAVSAYNVTSLMGPMTLTELLNTFAAQQFVCTEADLLAALEEALTRDLVKVLDGDKMVAAGPPGWVVWQRDDSIDPSGWTQWLCLNVKTKKTMPYQELLMQGATADA